MIFRVSSSFDLVGVKKMIYIAEIIKPTKLIAPEIIIIFHIKPIVWLIGCIFSVPSFYFIVVWERLCRRYSNSGKSNITTKIRMKSFVWMFLVFMDARQIMFNKIVVAMINFTGLFIIKM